MTNPWAMTDADVDARHSGRSTPPTNSIAEDPESGDASTADDLDDFGGAGDFPRWQPTTRGEAAEHAATTPVSMNRYAEPERQVEPPQPQPQPQPQPVSPPAAPQYLPPQTGARNVFITWPEERSAPPATPKAAPADDKAVPSPRPYRVSSGSDLVKNPNAGIGGLWRRLSRKFSGTELPPEQQVARIKHDLREPHTIVFCNHDGGCGKTTTAAVAGQKLAIHRRDRVIAIDAADAVGGLSQRLPIDNQSTIRTLLSNIHSIQRWSDARQHTSQGRTGLELLASGNSIADEDILSPDEYLSVIDVLTAHDTYNLLLVDCDAGVTGELMDEVFRTADVLVIPVAGQDGVAGGVATANRLRYLADKYPDDAGHYNRLLSDAIVVIGHLNRDSVLIDEKVKELFLSTIGVREVVSIPFDESLKDGLLIDVAALDKAADRQYLALTAAIVAAAAQLEGQR